jgi:MOSC domain-containing protein YiiM
MMEVFSWLRRGQPKQLRGTLVAIFVTDEAGADMRRVEQVEAVAGVGLAGDRYALDRGHWRRTDGCQVTLITEEDLRLAERRSALTFSAGEHRRNLVVRGVPLDAFRRRLVRIGDALFVFHRLRPPCGYLERLAGEGAARALGRGAGIGLRVVERGVLRIGDTVSVVTESEAGGS